MAFNISDFLNEESRKEIKSDWKPIRISVNKLRPAADKENFYHLDESEINALAKSIELVGLQQYPVVKPIEDSDEYEIIAGHKRRLAILKLFEEGKAEYEMIPCKIETAADTIRNELILIFTNSTQRNRTDYEQMKEIKRLKELLTEYQKSNELTGRKQNIIADILGTNKTKVGTLENIHKNLIEPFIEEFAAGKISTSTANEIAGLEPGAQQALYETYKETGALTAETARELKKGQEQLEEQMRAIQFLVYSPEDLQAEAKLYAEKNGISTDQAAEAISYERQQELQEDTEDTVITASQAIVSAEMAAVATDSSAKAEQSKAINDLDRKDVNIVNTSELDTKEELKSQVIQVLKDMLRVAEYITDDDFYILQDILLDATRCREGKGRIC